MKVILHRQVITGTVKAGDRKTYGPGLADVPTEIAKPLLADGTATKPAPVPKAEAATKPAAAGDGSQSGDGTE